MAFAKWVFTLGGIWGVLIVGSLFFLEGYIARTTGPISHPDTFYGFAVSTFAMQLGYLLIGRDPQRYRPFMLLGAAGKLAYAGFCWALFAQGRIPIAVPRWPARTSCSRPSSWWAGSRRDQ
jgi:hypothetical protein